MFLDRGTSPINDFGDEVLSQAKDSLNYSLEIPKLKERRLSVLNDSEIVSHPDSSSARYDVEIERMKSHSKYYKAQLNTSDDNHTAILDERSPTPSLYLTDTLAEEEFNPTYNELLDALVSPSDGDNDECIFIEDQSVNAVYEDIQESNTFTTVATIESYNHHNNTDRYLENEVPNANIESLDENEPITSLRAIKKKIRPKFLNDTYKSNDERQNRYEDNDLEENFEKMSIDDKVSLKTQRLSNMSVNSEITLENEIVEVQCPKKFSSDSKIIQLWKIKPTLGLHSNSIPFIICRDNYIISLFFNSRYKHFRGKRQ